MTGGGMVNTVPELIVRGSWLPVQSPSNGEGGRGGRGGDTYIVPELIVRGSRLPVHAPSTTQPFENQNIRYR